MQPRFVQIKAALIQQIEQGALSPGDQIGSENQLAERFSVSRMTARRAVSELVDEGILARTQGVGTFVSDNRPMSSMLTIIGIKEEIESRGHHYSNQIISQSVCEADAIQSRHLSVAQGARLYFIQLVHFENAQPVQLESRLVNPALAPLFLEQDFSQLSVNQYLNQVAPLTEADHSVEAVLPESHDAELLSIDTTQPCLRISRRTYCAKGIVSLATLTHPGQRYRLGAHLNFTSAIKESV